jgi:hypothetical protein
MARYTITYACGHTGDEQLYGPTKDRESYVVWAEDNKICPDCWQKKKEEERAARVAEQKATAEALREELQIDLPELEGTPKQIAWARDLLTQLIANEKIAWAIAHRLKSEKALRAKYWIDRRKWEEIDWARTCIRKQWDAIAEDSHEQKWALRILHGVVSRRNLKNDTFINFLYETKALVLPAETPKLIYDTNWYRWDYDQVDALEEYLVQSWCQTGLVEWAEKRIDKTAAEQTQKTAAAIMEAMKAEEAAKSKYNEAIMKLAQADQIKAQADEVTRESIENMAMILGEKGYIDGDVCQLTGIVNSGLTAVLVRNGAEEIMVPRSRWVLAWQQFRAEHPDLYRSHP